MFAPTEPNADRGISPVIGAALMITITVLLAAAVGATTLGLGGEALKDVPQASLSVDASPGADEIVIIHEGGDGLDAERTRLIISVAGTEASFDATSSSTVLTVGSSAVVDTAGDDRVDWDGDGSVESYSPSAGADVLPPLSPGDRITVKLIDVESQTTFFETSVTA